jgi:hypothetical protein
MAIQIGKYKRPGIFIEEFDKSIISSPVVEGITNLVIGVSKKGPVNTPIRVSTVGELESIFGQLDRGLERKGSFFHRTVSKMLETAPVFALNLLVTDDTLDTIEYQSLSTSAGSMNDIERLGSYRRFFDTTGFWKRDTESFINLTKPNIGYNERAFSITNLSDRYVTVFIIKSQVTGFDRTLLEWYGSVEKMPPYVNANDYASDYLVDVVVVAGDWSNYQNLAVDTRWSAYFNTSGLVKGQIRNFANDRNVTLLSYYEGLSLIPYFRDLNGRNIFIETTINRDTDSTGLFCAFNSDLVEKDYYTGLLDLLGNTLVGQEETAVDFLSYKETIAESIKITNTPLDLPGNVTGMLGGSWSGYGFYSQDPHAFQYGPGNGATNVGSTTSGIVYNSNYRTSWFSEGVVYGVELNSSTPTFGTVSGTTSNATQSVSFTFNVNDGAYVVIGDTYVPISATATLTVNSSDYAVTSVTASYTSTFIVDSSGEMSVASTTTADTNPTVASNDVVLGYFDFKLKNGYFVSTGLITYNEVTINTNGYVDYSFGTASTDDYYITETSTGVIKVEFPGTNTTSSVKNYEQWRKFKLRNRLVNIIDSPNKNYITMLLDAASQKKYSFENVTISDIVTSTTDNKSFKLNTTLTSLELADIKLGMFILYTSDNEFLLGIEGVTTKDTVALPSGYGVVAKYSNFYNKYYDGIINTKDYFYDNRLWVNSGGTVNNYVGESFGVTFLDGESATSGANVGNTSSYAGYNYILFNTTTSGFDTPLTGVDLQVNEVLLFPNSVDNVGTFTIVANSVNPLDNATTLADELGYASTAGDYWYAYQVNEEVVGEDLLIEENPVTLVYDYLVKHYLRMYLDNSSNLTVDFLDVTLADSDDSDADVKANNTFYIQSEKSNFTQTIEIEVPAGYVQVPNKILVDGSRYTELKVGDFLEAYYDSSLLQTGEFPRKLTRVLSKRQYAGDTSLTEVTCDSRIATYNYGGDLQTTRFVTIDQYATTYKAISLKGFRIRNASLPDGTETKQNQVLNLVAKGTPLFKALTNKEAIDFRYLIDSFGLGLTERSKQQLVDICGDRLDAFGFLNMPSLRSFKNSSSPTFVNTEGVLQLEYVAKGGDPESNPAFLYTFGDGAGTTCVGYFTPYVVVNDNGRPIDFPPASYVATTYMRKHISNVGSVTPWTIAAGVTNGRITNINSLEMDFTPSDIEFLNVAQMNPLVFKRNRGFVIETENTGQTLYKSALSYIHVREVLIELERELSRMLLDFQWKFNTPDIRAEIKLRADVICETYVSKNGLFNYFNKMDDENNTAEIIDNQIGVLDTYVEPIKGMGVIVNNITILRTGAISAGGFINS